MNSNMLMRDASSFDYSIRKSKRARSLRITIYRDRGVVVTLPHRLDESVIQRFLTNKSRWIHKKLELLKRRPVSKMQRFTRRDYLKQREAARKIIVSHARRLSEQLGYTYKRISIRNQRTCWGSCSQRGNLNFNFRLAFLPPELRDYIIIHELCHLKEMNHSRRFWALVAEIVPDYKQKIVELKKYSLHR